MEPDPIQTPPQNLIVVGSSAGGVEALSTLVAGLSVGLPAAVVIAQHLDPNRPSQLAEILSGRGPLPVRTVESTETLVAGTVYVVPADRHVSITDHEVSVHADASVRPTPSVDLLLTTAAEVFGERLVAVILSGTGSDGAAGAHVVKEAGGTVVIQDPATAAFPSMPRSLAPPLVDVVAPIGRIGPMLGELLDVGPTQASEDGLASLLDRLRQNRGVDFSAYKHATIYRRLRRRMAAAGVTDLPAYIEHLDANPDEEGRLVADFLIKVTRFFRDDTLFEELRDSILPELLTAATRERRELRIWSAGCATGEEAYSLAILVADLVAQRGAPGGVRIFATDLDPQAVDFARRGVYSTSAVGGLPPETITRHFIRHQDGFEVRKEIRSLIVFGHHDLGQRPPFPHIDLVLCRNVLIYFTPALQRRALDVFAYSLRDGGYLVLGKSESTGNDNRAFTPVVRRLRLYRRQGARQLVPLSRMPATLAAAPVAPALLPVDGRPSHAESPSESGGLAESLIRRLPVGVVVVDRSYDIQLINGAARELLGVHGIAVGQDLIHLAQRVSSRAIRAAVDAVTVSQHDLFPLADSVVTTESATGEVRHLAIACHPERTGGDGEVETVMVLITDVTVATEAERTREEEVARIREDAATRRAATERLAAAQVSAEEIETLNEELQSSNEELETLHEESQATVEELNVANEELQARATELEELAAAHSAEQARLAAVLAGMSDAVLVVDRRGRTLLANDAHRALADADDRALVPGDERGIPLPADADPRARAAKGEAFQMEFTAAGPDGPRRWFEAVARPLPDGDSAVLVIRDITDRSLRRLQEEFLSWAGHELRTPLAALQSYLQLAVRRAGPEVDERLRVTLESAIGQTRRQAALIDELLDAGRLRSGRLVLRRQRLDLVELVGRVAETARVLADGQEIVVATPPSPVEVDVDPGRVEQVLLNLLTNAITYAPGTDRIELTVRVANGTAEVAVRDHGPGIRPETVGLIFERFGRANDIRTGTGGLGLGLYIAREIARAHDGELEVASMPGSGSVFTLRLPRPGSAAYHDAPPAAGAAPVTG